MMCDENDWVKDMKAIFPLGILHFGCSTVNIEGKSESAREMTGAMHFQHGRSLEGYAVQQCTNIPASWSCQKRFCAIVTHLTCAATMSYIVLGVLTTPS